MNICVEILARLLEPDERAAVLGDLAESHDRGMKAFREVAGLVLRRQLALWKDWLALLAMVGVICPMLLRVAAGVVSPLLLNVRTYLRVGSPYSSGLTCGEEVSLFLTGAISLLFWSWTSGFVLACLSRKILSHGPVVLAAREAALLTAVILCVTALSVWMGGWPHAAVTRWAGGAWDPRPGWPHRLFFYTILAWPTAYLLLMAKLWVGQAVPPVGVPNTDSNGTPFAKLKAHGEFRG